ncbi:MAG: patatin-like phospholipase family protein [Dokdonella sp.]
MSDAKASVSDAMGLALQGGGAHGAFTWGVLDRLLEHGELSFSRVSATSSGALNALALAQGWMNGGREGARTCLDVLWQRIAGHPMSAPWIFGSRMPAAQPGAQNLHRYYTARQINPSAINPVEQIAEVMFDFEQLRSEAPFPIHLAATRVRDGGLRLFGPEELNVDALLASTCLPQIFAPVRIDGETYWDGGWAGNPVLEPLLGPDQASTILGILVQPLDRSEIPTTPERIATRIGELGFSTAFLRELRSLLVSGDSPQALAASNVQGLIPRVLLIEPGESLHDFHDKTPFKNAIGFLSMLRDHGRVCADRWIANPEHHVINRDSRLFQQRKA